MKQSNQLSNNFDQPSLKSYFLKVRELQSSGNKFPVNLEDVWPLAYTAKSSAIRELEKSFIEGEDFYLYQNVKVVKINELKNGVKYDCYLSVSCLEYFIVRKVRAVFDVYRTVFHKAMTALESGYAIPTSFSEALIMAGKLQAEKEMLLLENAKMEKKSEYVDKVLESVTEITTTTIAKELGMSAQALNRILCEKGIQYKNQNHFVLYAKYQNKGYATIATHQYYGSDGNSHTTHYLVWTERGRVFIHSLLNPSLSWSKASLGNNQQSAN